MNRKEKILRRVRAFLRGMGDVLVLYPEPIKRPQSLQQKRPSDWEAIAGDWLAVGNDLRKVMGETYLTDDGRVVHQGSNEKSVIDKPSDK